MHFLIWVFRDIQRIEPKEIDCGIGGSMPNYWQHGSSILNFMRVSHIPGLSRHNFEAKNNIFNKSFRDIQFDSYGRRTKFELDIVNLFETEGLMKVGSWDDENGIIINGNSSFNFNFSLCI